MITAQGGDAAAVEHDRLPRSPVMTEISAGAEGVLAQVDGFALGELVVSLGGGRRAKEDVVDPRVGFAMHKRLGDRVTRGEPVMTLHLAHEDADAVRRAAACLRIGDDAVTPPPLV